MAYAQNRSQSVPTYIVIYLFTTYARTYTHTHTYTYHPLSPSSWLRDRRIKWCERPCACIDLNWVSPRVQSHLISLYDYVIKTVSLSLSQEKSAGRDITMGQLVTEVLVSRESPLPPCSFGLTMIKIYIMEITEKCFIYLEKNTCHPPLLAVVTAYEDVGTSSGWSHCTV